ncbi:MAG: hemin receptor [Polaribacter sp.]|nr:hemin receptor [Polaribacter sp.]
MKRFYISAILFAVTLTSFSQNMKYQDLGVLFSQDDNYGTARFTAMSGAFGALGGDISAININPAGLSVFNYSTFTGTLNSKNTDINASYGDASFNDRRITTTNNLNLNLAQAGAVLVFDDIQSKDWSKFAIGFNYRIAKDFSNDFSAGGNEAVTRFDSNPRDSNIYDFTNGQFFDNNYDGEISELSFVVSAVHQKKLHIGLSLNFYDLNFFQQSILTELNSDADGNILDVELFQDNLTTGNGFSGNLGFIYKLHKSFRFGASYQTPTWYTEINQETNYNQDSNIDIGDTIYYPGNEDSFTEYNDFQWINYSLRTPSKLTGSAAFIFRKNGLLSLDYTHRNYRNIKFSNGVFTNENQFYQNRLRNTHNYNIGTEWRFDNFSIRGGYNYEQTPFITNNLDNDSITNFSDVEGYSFGGGYNFGVFKVDLAYTNNNRTANYNFYPGFNVDPASLNIDNRVFTATVSISL